jgi:DNA-binding HxlR family transcriptional regulator
MGHTGDPGALEAVHPVEGTRRFYALLQALEGVSQKVFTPQLRELERDGIVLRTVHLELPPRVE